MNADAQIKEILAKYEEDFQTSVWRVQGQAVIYHKTLERIAARAKIFFELPTILRSERDEAVILVHGHIGGRAEWSIGEALVGVNYRVSGKQAAYVWAMAEKRARDRVILKIIGLHGLLYSEDESDDFKAGRPENDNPPTKTEVMEGCYFGNSGAAGVTITSGRLSAYQARKDERWEPLVASLRAAKTMDDLEKWTDDNTDAFEQLPGHWVEELREEYKARAYEIKTGR